MNIFCENPCITCDPIPLGGEGIFPNPNSEANPFANFSSEAPDQIIYLGGSHTAVLGDPPLGPIWQATGCVGICLSAVSQEEANLCAARQQVLCTPWPPNPQIPPGQPPDICITNPELCLPVTPTVFANDSQICAIQCAGDGSFFTFTVAAGIFLEFNQQLANDKAYSYACQKAVANALCFGTLSRSAGCTTEAFYSQITVTSFGSRPITFDIPSGSLPPGLFPSMLDPQTQVFSGTPTTGGTYAFVLRATDALGNSVSKNLIINIVGITTTTLLPSATSGAAYSTFLIGEGPIGTPIWTVMVGSLPPGLTLDAATGEISGTVTAGTPAGSYDFQVTMNVVGL
jgi:hypothetical protein